MFNSKNMRTAHLTSIIIVSFLFLILQISLSNALNLQIPTIITAENNQNVSFYLEISNNVSEVTVSKNISEGSIVFDGSKYLFSWISNYGSNNHKNILFTVNDNQSVSSKSLIIAKPTLITGLDDIYANSSILDISLETDLEAICKYSLSDKSFSSMEYTFKSDNDKFHEGITPSLSQGIHNMFVICKTTAGAESKSSFKIDVNLYPSAEIRLKPSSPLRAGIISVEVVASKNLISSPELKYYFDDDSNPKSITLTGSGNRWSGFMVIHESDKRRIGTFLFKGIDTTNLVGTDITSGKIFIIDNHVPSRVSSFEAEIKNDQVRLEWKYLDESFDEIDEYRIYKKSGSGGVDYINYLTTTSKEYYDDYDVVYGEAYYYKISAVNHASKEGPLSNEVAVTFVPSRQEEVVDSGLAPELRTELKNKISFVESLILDVDLAESRLQRLSGIDEQISQNLGLLANIVASRNKLKNVVSELSALESKSLAYSDFDRTVSNLIDEANSILKDVPVGLDIKDSVTYQETKDSSLSRSVLEKFLVSENLNLSNKDVVDLLNYLVDAQNIFSVESTLTNAVVVYSDKEKEVSFISKKVSFPDVLVDVVILDNILSLGVDDVVFSERPVVIDNSIVKWDASEVSSKTVSYYSFSENSFDAFKDSRVFVFRQEKVVETKNLLTGMVTSDVERSSHPLLVPLIIGILSVLLLSVYYFKSDDVVVSNLFSFRNFWFSIRNLFVKEDDSHKKLNLEKPPSFTNVVSSIDTVEASDVGTGFDNNDLNARLGNVNGVNDVHDVNSGGVESIEDYSFDDSLKDEVSAVEIVSDVSNKGTSAVSKENVISSDFEHDSQSINDEVLDTLYDLKNIVEDIYVSNTSSSFDDDFKYVSKVRKLRKQFSKPAPQGKEFLLRDGRMLKNLKELRDSLRFMSDDVFYHHVSISKNDFYFWVRDVFGYRALASRIKNVKSKDELFRKLKL